MAFTVDLLAAITSDRALPVFLFEGEFQTGGVRIWSGVGNIDFNGETFTGLGIYLSMSPIQVSDDVASYPMSVQLDGVPLDLVSLAILEARQNMKGRIWFGAWDTDTETLVADPHMSFVGLLDEPIIDEDGQSATITVRYESRLIELTRPNDRRYTNEQQQAAYPADRAFEYVAQIQEGSTLEPPKS